MKRESIDSELAHWKDIAKDFVGCALLAGNGASQAVWSRFAYSSLYHEAMRDGAKNRLSADDARIFESLDTTNFEQVLNALATSRRVCSILGIPASTIENRYASIRQALVDAVHRVHVEHSLIPETTLRTIRDSLQTYRQVFSTNYDLLIYWAIMLENGDGFKDLFWTEEFELSNTKVWGNTTQVLYLHGGLHLQRTSSGKTRKRRSSASDSLLASFSDFDTAFSTPLFVSEGDSSDKLRSINSSDYLSFAYSKFVQCEENLVVFGHSLGVSDAHITAALAGWGGRKIAISLVAESNPKNIIAKKANLLKQLPEAQLSFFEASTHPLGHKYLQAYDDYPL